MGFSASVVAQSLATQGAGVAPPTPIAAVALPAPIVASAALPPPIVGVDEVGGGGYRSASVAGMGMQRKKGLPGR